MHKAWVDSLGAALIVAAVTSLAAAQTPVTFTKDVAPILFEHCASCHRPGEIGGFSLLTYPDVRPRARAIARATLTRAMPPWKPEPGYGEFLGARRLTDAQIDTIRRWAAGGAIEGDPGDLPAAPAFSDGWRLGQPDLVVQMAEPFTLALGGDDVLRNFVIPIPIDRLRYVRGLEFRPGNGRVVHHANLRIDTTRMSRAMDEADPQPGYDGFMTTAQFPDGHFLGWTPGQLPPLLGEGMAWRLEPNTDLVLQLHLQPSGRPEVVQASIGLFFTDRPPERRPLMLRLGRQHIDIPPGARTYSIEDSYVLPVDVDLYAVQPHAHFRAKEIRGVATLPDGTKKWLLYIKDWDFNWQDVYRYIEPIPLPKGTRLGMRYVYDNSTLNPRNPDRPAKRVRWGQRSSDEMGDLWLQVRPRSEDDLRLLYADFEPKVLAEDAVGYETMLEGDPGNGRLHEAVAALYLRLDRTREAVAHLEDALRINPQSVEAHYNLGTALVWQGRRDDAIDHFRRTLAIDPRHAAAAVNLGVVLRLRNQLDEATQQLRRALELAPDNAVAHANLGGALAAQGRIVEAVTHYRRALDGNPELLEPLTELAWLLATSASSAIRAPAEAVRLAERAVALTAGTSVRPLETLAAAYAAAGRFDRAFTTEQLAITLAETAGTVEAAALLRERLERYRRRQALFIER